MTGFVSRHLLLIVTLLVLGACSSSVDFYRGSSNDRVDTSGGAVKVGKPYKIAGKWYHPEDNRNYSEIGYASWYGPGFHGKKTANGERFDQNAMTAAHKTLPMPSWVKVTNLENGRTVMLRINDRGPFVDGRIIDLSRRGAQLLGFSKQGVTKVHVTRVRSDGTAYPSSGRQVAVAVPSTSVESQSLPIDPRRRDGSASRLPQNPSQSSSTIARNDIRNEPPVYRPVTSASGIIWIQIGAFTSRQNATNLLTRLTGLGQITIQEVNTAMGRIYRLRIGPFSSRDLADRTLPRVRSRGFPDARVLSDSRG